MSKMMSKKLLIEVEVRGTDPADPPMEKQVFEDIKEQLIGFEVVSGSDGGTFEVVKVRKVK